MKKPNILFICLGAYKIASYNVHQNFDRQSVYSIALNRLLQIAENEEKNGGSMCDLIVIDNTVSSQSEILPELEEQLSHPHIKDVLLINNNNLGSKNKGAGEYLMCRAVLEKQSDLVQRYDWIVYYTLRQIITSPLVIEYIKEEYTASSTKEIIVGNPPYHYSDGAIKSSADGNYCDMIFAMKPNAFVQYIESMTPEELASRKMSSEQNLYHFVQGKKDNSREVDMLGVMRHDYAINKTQIL